MKDSKCNIHNLYHHLLLGIFIHFIHIFYRIIMCFMCLHRDQPIVEMFHYYQSCILIQHHSMPKNVKENISESGISGMLCVIAIAMLNATGVWTDTVVDEKAK